MVDYKLVDDMKSSAVFAYDQLVDALDRLGRAIRAEDSDGTKFWEESASYWLESKKYWERRIREEESK